MYAKLPMHVDSMIWCKQILCTTLFCFLPLYPYNKRVYVKLPMDLFYTSNIKSLILMWGSIPYTFLFSYFPTHTNDTKNSVEWKGEGGGGGEGRLMLILSCRNNFTTYRRKNNEWIVKYVEGGGGGGGGGGGRGRLFLIHSCSKNHDFIFNVQKKCIGNFMYMSKQRFFSLSPTPILTLFCCMGKGVLLQLYGWKGKKQNRVV